MSQESIVTCAAGSLLMVIPVTCNVADGPGPMILQFLNTTPVLALPKTTTHQYAVGSVTLMIQFCTVTFGALMLRIPLILSAFNVVPAVLMSDAVHGVNVVPGTGPVVVASGNPVDAPDEDSTGLPSTGELTIRLLMPNMPMLMTTCTDHMH